MLHAKYKQIWGIEPNPHDYLCTYQEYIEALNTAIKEHIELSNLLNLNPKRIKNQVLIGKLTGKAGSVEKTSAAKVKQLNRKDTSAAQNIEKIKNGGIVDTNLADNKVVKVVSEIRTVQSNKNLQKTRKAVIVRQNREHATRTFIAKLANVLSFAIVSVVAIVFGIFAGNMYIASKTLVNYDYNETEFLPAYSTVYASNKNLAKNQVSATNAYIMAEWLLLRESGLTDNYTITANGTVSAKVGGIQQKQIVAKKVEKTPESYTNESVTNGLIPAAEIYKYDFAQNKVESFFSQDVSGEPPTATYGTDPYKTYDLNTQMADFRAEYGVKPENIFAPIVSDKTVDKALYIGEENGGYKYQITLNNIYSVINYVQLMIHISGLERPPTFNEITITFTVDENYRFKEVHFFEKYQIYYLGLPADCTAETTYNFAY